MKTDYPTEAQARYCSDKEVEEYLDYIDSQRFDIVSKFHIDGWDRYHNCERCKVISYLQQILWDRLP